MTKHFFSERGSYFVFLSGTTPVPSADPRDLVRLKVSKCCSSPQSVVPFMILVVFVKSNLIVTYIVSFAAGVGVASAFLLPW